MPILSLAQLKENACFVSLNQLQNQFDSNDRAMLRSQFTRSPLHAVQFLIAYTGLTTEQRERVVSNLNTPEITQSKMDALIEEIDWEAILKAPTGPSTVQFRFTIGLADKEALFNALQEECPDLYQALKSNDCIISIDNTLSVTFTSTLTQTELWEEPFIIDNTTNRWKVPCFLLSPSFVDIINNMRNGWRKSVGCFTVMKGTGELANTAFLRIVSPMDSNLFTVANKIDTNAGIYGAFLGLTNFYGLPQVDIVKNTLESSANFSNKGASASQCNVFEAQTLGFKKKEPGRPTYVIVKHLNVLFKGIDIVASFTKNTAKSNSFDPNIYIDLPTRSKNNTSVTLYAHAPNPKSAFALVTPGIVVDRSTWMSRVRNSLFYTKPEDEKKALVLEGNDSAQNSSSLSIETDADSAPVKNCCAVM